MKLLSVDLIIALILLVLGVLFIANPSLISWFPAVVHYIIGAIAIIGALFYGAKGLK